MHSVVLSQINEPGTLPRATIQMCRPPSIYSTQRSRVGSKDCLASMSTYVRTLRFAFASLAQSPASSSASLSSSIFSSSPFGPPVYALRRPSCRNDAESETREREGEGEGNVVFSRGRQLPDMEIVRGGCGWHARRCYDAYEGLQRSG